MSRNDDVVQDMIGMAKRLIETRLEYLFGKDQLGRKREWVEVKPCNSDAPDGCTAFYQEGTPPLGRIYVFPEGVEAYVCDEIIHTFTLKNMNSPETTRKYKNPKNKSEG